MHYTKVKYIKYKLLHESWELGMHIKYLVHYISILPFSFPLEPKMICNPSIEVSALFTLLFFCGHIN